MPDVASTIRSAPTIRGCFMHVAQQEQELVWQRVFCVRTLGVRTVTGFRTRSRWGSSQHLLAREVDVNEFLLSSNIDMSRNMHFSYFSLDFRFHVSDSECVDKIPPVKGQIKTTFHFRIKKLHANTCRS